MARRIKLDMLIDYQKCRTWGHGWEDFIPLAGTKRPAPWGRRFSLRCVRCGMERHDVFDGLGRISTRHYDAPPDYSTTRDERPSIEQLRLSLSSSLADEYESAPVRRRPVKQAPKKTQRRRLVAVS